MPSAVKWLRFSIKEWILIKTFFFSSKWSRIKDTVKRLTSKKVPKLEAVEQI